MCTHAAWVLGTSREGCCRGSKHLKLCVSFVVLQCLARLRLGLHDLQVRLGRIGANKVPRHQRLCRLCSTDGAPLYRQRGRNACVEDLRHFVLECLAYGHVRVRYSAVFGTAPALGTNSHAAFHCDCQDQLAHVLYTTRKFRALCLSHLQGSVVNVGILQLIVDDGEELGRIQ